MCKKNIFLLFIICTALLLTISVSATAEPAVLLTPSVTASDGGETWMFSDNNRITKRYFPDGGSINLKSDNAITGLYLVWDAPAPTCIISCDKIFSVQTHSFLHEFIKLPNSVQDVNITWDGTATLCDIIALSSGDLPEWVQSWKPSQNYCDLLLLPTHADDEQLYFGGAMAIATAIPDCEVQVAYMVNHNGEYYRPHELLNGLWAAGVRRYPIIPEFPDVYSDSLKHAKTIYDEDNILNYQTELINLFHPQVIIGHDLDGEYGHGAHMLNAHTLTRSVEQAAKLPNGWDTPKLYLHLYEENQILLDLSTPLERFGGKSAFEIAQQGFAAHKSQQQFFTVEQSGPYDCRKFGLYRTTVGADTGTDMFEHITLYANQEPVQAIEPPATECVITDSSSESPESTQAELFLPEATNDKAFAFIGSPLLLALAATALLLVILLFAIFHNRRI